MSSSLWLMAAYIVISFALQALAFLAGTVFDGLLGSWSMPTFVILYFLMFWIAWPIALRVTDPARFRFARAH